MRYDEKRQIYRDCRFCHGQGCLACPGEADKAYKAAFPDGPKPTAVFSLATPEGVEAARRTIGAEAITKAFSEGGGGIAEIMENARREGGTS